MKMRLSGKSWRQSAPSAGDLHGTTERAKDISDVRFNIESPLSVQKTEGGGTHDEHHQPDSPDCSGGRYDLQNHFCNLFHPDIPQKQKEITALSLL